MNFDGFDFDDNIKQTFNTLDIQGRVPHAVVIESRDSEKAMNLAVFLSMYAVCTEPVKPCGHCEQCHKAKNKAHADIKYVELPNDRKQNSIEQMREIIGDSVIKPNEADAKVYIFPFADFLKNPRRMYISLCSAKTPRNCSRQFSPVQVYSV